MFCLKQMIKANRAQAMAFPTTIIVDQRFLRCMCLFKRQIGFNSTNLKVLPKNVSSNVSGGNLEKTAKMERRHRQNQKVRPKSVVLNHLSSDPKLPPPSESSKEKNGTQETGIEFQNSNELKQQHYFQRVICTVLSKNVKDYALSGKHLSPQLAISNCPKNIWENRKDAPKNPLEDIFIAVANKYKYSLFLLEMPEFNQKELSCLCTYKIVWPKHKTFTEVGISKKDASHNTAMAALQWLQKNNYMDQLGKPMFCFQSLKLSDNIVVKPQIRLYSTNRSAVDLNANNISPPLVQSSPRIEEKNIETIKSPYAAPKNVLHNCFDVLANELKQKDLKVTPQYKIIKQGKNSVWSCTYNLKWPEVLKFSETANTKQEASHKAALQALSWLAKNSKITVEGQPIIYDKREVRKLSKKSYPVVILNKSVEKKMKDIINIFKNNLELKTVINIDEEDSANVGAEEELTEKWPEFENVDRFPQKFTSLEFYLAKEPVELPISKYRENIMKLLNNNHVVIIKGEPGCGKSTRVPQYALESWAKNSDVNREPGRIIVTQPRRIAAISLAERVASEREESVGRTVGYHVRLNSNFNKHTGHIMYCTTGILLRRLQSDPKLSDCSHVLLDEAHERDVNTDLLMNLLRHALNLNPKLKVLVMSATIDVKIFQDYFNNAPVLHIPGFAYPVDQNFLKENYECPTKTYQMCMGQYPNVVTEEVVQSILYIHKNKPEGAILCFLPGWEDIRKVRDAILEKDDMAVLCLHSRLQMSEQRKIFSRPPPGIRKVVLATNIAETSVTIDDVVYVIDTGIHKEERFDVEKGVTCIDNHWISQASALQRKGRAGRCQPGECFHMYPQSKYDQLPEYSIPEILRTSLTKIVLDSKVYSNNMNAEEFFEQLLCPPEKSAIKKALEELQELELLNENENLTPLGRTVSDFQLAPKLSKAMVNAVIFKCVTPIIDIATLYSAESAVFSKSLVDKEGIKNVMNKYSDISDHMAFMELFETWLAFVENGDDYMAETFCMDNGLVSHKMRTLQKLREIHMDYLRKGLKDVLPLADDLSDNSELVRAVLLSGVGTVLQHRTWDVVKGRLKKANVFVTRNNSKATITSESVNFKKSKFLSSFLLYINETVSNLRHTTLVRETSQISPLAVLLFRIGDLEIEDVAKGHYSDMLQSSDQVLLKLKGTKIQFLCDSQQAVIIQKCKEVLRCCMQYYIYQLTKGGKCDAEVDAYWHEILASVNDILESQKVGRK